MWSLTERARQHTPTVQASDHCSSLLIY